MAAKLKSIEKYGCRWAGDLDPLEIEMYAIRQGGYWTTKDGIKHGEGLIAHYLAARSLLWPKRYRHRWTDLIYKTVLENQIAILVGPASSQKTSHLSEIVLISYFAFPHDTAVLVSTTSVDKLDSSVFGEIKMLWKDARELHDTLPGHMIDYRHAIVTDDAKEGARDMRCSIQGKALYLGAKYVGLGVFCFPAGQLVDTEKGPQPIESLQTGTKVWSAIGLRKVVATGYRIANQLVRIHLTDGRQIDCTPEHPIFTSQGWVNAIDLHPEHAVFSPHETMQILRQGYHKGRSNSLLQYSMQGQRSDTDLSSVQTAPYSIGFEERSLFQTLHDEIEDERSGVCGSHSWESRSSGKRQSHQYCNSIEPSRTTNQTREASQKQSETEAVQGLRWIGDRSFHAASRNNSYGIVSRSHAQPLHSDRGIIKTAPSSYLLPGFGVDGYKVGCRNRRSIPSHGCPKEEGRNPQPIPEGTRVDRVEVLEQAGDARYNESEGGYRVYNIQVEGHPSYSVNGVIVHNSGIKQNRFWFLADELQYCPSTFLDCIPNMRSNTGAGGLHVLGSGNPNHDTESQLGVVAEPPEGWASVEGNEQTSVWPIKLSGGVCLNLIGTDSPNFDGPEDEDDKYPRLIGRAFERIIAHDYGANSPTYETQVKGRMKLSLAHSRVITRQLCRDHHAHDRALWEGVNRTRVYATDPAYGGGDRCVTGWGEFGRSDTGKIIFRVNPPRIIKINVKAKLSPEDQISEAVFNDLKELQIQPDHAGYDSFGKGTIGFALARKFGADCPVPIDAGAQPTKRPVRAGLFIQDEQRHERRLKQCSEHYAKFITEMWFSVRYMIEAEQMRELPMDVMSEGCWREYKTVAGDKIEVEPKDKMKERTGKSPDLFDWLAILIEMARRCGFLIDKLGEPTDSGDDEGYFESEAREYQQAIRGHLLQHR